MKTRTPLRLLPRKNDDLSFMDDGQFQTGTSISNRGGNAPLKQEPAARFAPLISERERTKLILQPRSIPVESQSDEVNDHGHKDQNVAFSRARKPKNKKPVDAEAIRKVALAAAFASDEESDWDVGDEVYSGDEDG